MSDGSNFNTEPLFLTEGNIDKIKDKRSLKWVYITGTFISIAIATSILLFIAIETYHQTDRQLIAGVEHHSNLSKNVIDYKKILDNKLNGMNVDTCIDKLKINENNVDSKRMIVGFETYQALQKYVDTNKKIHYEELQNEIKPFLDEVRSKYNTSSDTLYFGYMARDIIFYIYIHNNVFLIHDDDKSLMGIDGRSLKSFYEDATSVYDYLKYILIDGLNEKELFYKDADNGNLFLITMYCKARKATTGINKTKDIESILQEFKSNNFAISGQTKERLDWLEKDLNDVNKDFTRMRLEQNRPEFISPIWLK